MIVRRVNLSQGIAGKARVMWPISGYAENALRASLSWSTRNVAPPWCHCTLPKVLVPRGHDALYVVYNLIAAFI
jgi:hypothetical protein